LQAEETRVRSKSRRPPRRRPPARPRRREPALTSDPPPGTAPLPARLVPRRGDGETLAIGTRRAWLGDLYHHLLTLPWWLFLLALGAVYLVANLIFALLYSLQPGAILQARAGSFTDAFFFSVQTMATIGYGQMAPATFFANLLMTVETLFGLTLLAVATGLVFARFSRPTARVLFSRSAVVGPYNGTPTLSLRLANERRNQILEAHVAATLVRDEVTAEGVAMRRFYPLALLRDRSPVFSLTFTVMHPIDASSPLNGASPQSLEAQGAEIVVTVSGIDEAIWQAVHARTSYLAPDILWGHRFADMIGWTADGRRAIDYRRFHDTEKLPQA
jgi:inward rectifier potassium channel